MPWHIYRVESIFIFIKKKKKIEREPCVHNHITQHYDIPSHSFFFHSVRIFVLCIPFNEMLLLIISQTLNLIYYLLNSTILRFTTHCSTHAAFYFLSIWVLYIYFFLLNENKMCTSRNSKWCVCVCVYNISATYT